MASSGEERIVLRGGQRWARTLSLGWTCALVTATFVGSLGFTPQPVTAPAGPSGIAATAQRPNRSNVGATHSPQLLRQLAGSAGAGQRSASVIVNAALAGAKQGVDVASFQHPSKAPINWQQVAVYGIQFAAVKATEGNYYKNPYALTDLAGARAAGLSTVAYAFAIPNGNGGSASPATQASYLLSYLGSSSGTVPVLLDIEYDPYVNTDHTNECYGLSPAAMVKWISGFDSAVQAKTGRLPIIYTTANWWYTCTGDSTAFGQTPLWVANYTAANSPLLPAGRATWAFWQYSSAGNVPGISGAGHVDLDQLNPSLIPLLNPGARKGAKGSSVSFKVSQADPVPGQTVSFSAKGLPPGVSISAAGKIAGRLAATGTYRPTVTAASGGISGSVSFTWTVS
jgi:GH25 family lysozyme M1 (1,4-beta-N-acetylmuramidase)